MWNDRLSRRRLLAGGAQAAMLAACAPRAGKTKPAAKGAQPFPLEAVRLKPSPFRAAVEANRRYLLSLEPDRLLHNFRLYAGLEPKGAVYGGWEGETIAGHTLGHYLSALSLMHAQTGDETCKARALYVVGELALCQGAHGDGYVAGFTRKSESGQIESGRLVFDEIRRGDIRPSKFYINGSWAPLYNWHKLFAGLLDAERYCGSSDAVAVASGLAGYLDGVFAPLSDEQIQKVLSCEFGGIAESLAELYARTGEERWLALAEKLYHRAVLDPLAEKRDALSHLHANTQIPKLIALARLHQLTGEPSYATAAHFFWETVTAHRSYVIGGNSDREYFQEANSISKYITEQTCESCNTYNMMKLTRLLYEDRPLASYFDYYERCHFNHILAQQRPEDGMFAYMVPLMAGSRRSFSTPYDSFWCCVGTGLESHAKHGDSIYWRDDETLFVNLFIPSTLDWTERGARFDLDTDYPWSGDIRLAVEAAHGAPLTVALRIPGWAKQGARIEVNGEAVPLEIDARGYACLRRAWRPGDVATLALPMQARVEPTPDDPDTIALLHGPLALAADLGPVEAPWDGPAPALVAENVLAALTPENTAAAAYRVAGAGRPADLRLRPFFEQRDRRTAVYFKRYTPAQWEEAQAAFAAERARLAALDARSSDLVRLGDGADERAHHLDADISYAVVYRGRKGRDARDGGFFAFDMAADDGPLILQATYWGGERERVFHIFVDGTRIATQTLDGAHPWRFIDVDYPIPPELTAGKTSIRIRFEPESGYSAGPAFGCRLFRQAG
ncbi:MAG: glycoside hydrolase family 127 protein [Amphiplicatus sp.]